MRVLPVPRSIALLIAALGAFHLFAARADYPDRPIRYIVPSAAGNGADISARMLTAELATQMKAQFVIDNRPTAGGVIGVGMLARSPADGYTLGYANMVYLSIFPSLMSNLPYDIDRDLQVIGRFTSGQNLLAVRPGLPVNSVAELVNLARANPDKLTFASSGNGTTLHLSGELFKQMTGTRMVYTLQGGAAGAHRDHRGSSGFHLRQPAVHRTVREDRTCARPRRDGACPLGDFSRAADDERSRRHRLRDHDLDRHDGAQGYTEGDSRAAQRRDREGVRIARIPGKGCRHGQRVRDGIRRGFRRLHEE